MTAPFSVPPTAGLAALPGIGVGHHAVGRSGVTVVRLPPGTVGSAEVRGGAPATREIALLDPRRTVATLDAVVFTGGSAFGLATADGVMRALANVGRGVPTAGGPVPIVPTAAIFDLVASGGDVPGAADGETAWRAAEASVSSGPPLPAACGRVGAGRAATVGKWRGAEHGVAGGLGEASASVPGATIAALAVVNAAGDVVADDRTDLAASTAPADVPARPALLSDRESTTLVVVATDLVLSKLECRLLAESAFGGFARALRPACTAYDGDLVVALATGRAVEGTSPPVARATGGKDDADRRGAVEIVRAAAPDVVAAAIRAAVAG